MGRLSRLACFLSIALIVSAAHAAIRTVGAGKTYSNIAAAVSAANATGDIIEIYPGTYSGSTNIVTISKSLTIRGVGTRPVLDATGKTIANSKAIFVTATGTDITVENLEFKGASVPDKNGAGIRAEGARLTVRYCYFHDNENGILGGAAGSQILIEYCEFNYNGYGDGYSHNVYISAIDKLTFRYNYSHRQRGTTAFGHLLKSRAQANYILYNFLADENTDASYEIDLPQGGQGYIVGNLIQQGANSSQGTIIAYAAENLSNTNHQLYVVNNTIVNDRSAGTFISLVRQPTNTLIMNNIFVGNGTILNGTAKLTNNVTLNGTQLVNRAAYNYQLIPTSTAIDAGLNPGSTNGFSLTPVSEYAASATGRVRAVEWKLDQGAYECTNAVGDRNSDGMEDNWQRRFFGTLANPSTAPSFTNVNGFTTLQSYQAGLIPTNPASRLAIRSLAVTGGQATVHWIGGTSVWQYVKTSPSLTNAAAAWRVVYTNAPTLATTNTVRIGNVTNQTIFFRISAGQP
jgi:hypothetical protein